MRTLQWALTAAGISAALLFLNSCSSNPHAAGELYILVADNTKIPYWQSAYQGLMRATSEMKVKEGQIQGPDGHDPQGEHQAFQRALAQKPAGILVSATDANVLTPDINSAISQNIPVITIDSDAPDSKRLFFVGTDNFNAVTIGGHLASNLIGGKGNVVIFTIASQANLKDRLHGYQAAFNEHPGIHILDTIDMNGNSDIAFDNTKKLIDGKTKVDAFIA
jgi:ribose transport system substrate-binding protein